ncbi:hypothetical protein Leryth_003716 [Lithospermum erythrorhizon]|uniref:Probable glutathione S-transferase n=1 Tax=Lithospermum erythrorhizon TaxID=34254 RepID=A0AAV3PM90_LITER|nr:hypothetical protein Leryth_003716 [Lithospermum erythrorhizon]
MEKEGVQLIGFWVSPFVQRVKWALKMKGVEYEYIEVDIWNKSPLLLELNPVYKRVPVFVHNGKVLVESKIILEYIDETWRNNPLLLPQHPYQRAMARFLADFFEKKILEAGFEALCTRGERQEKAVSTVIEAMEKLEQELKGKKFMGGDSIGYLDLVIGWLGYKMPIWEELASIKILDSSKFPLIDEWINNFLSHPLIKDDLPTTNKMKDYFYHISRKLAASHFGSEI